MSVRVMWSSTFVRRAIALVAMIAQAALAGMPAVAADGEYRVVVLTRTASYLVVSGGDALRVASGCACATLPAGTPAIVKLDGGGTVIELRRATSADTAGDKLPPNAVVVDPRSSRTLKDDRAAVHDVTVTLTVAVPSDTPPGDSMYVSTARSGWSAAELRMERVDPLHWSISLRLPENQPLLYRYSRGSFQSLEADRSGQLSPARKLTAREALVVRDTVVRFSDSS